MCEGVCIELTFPRDCTRKIRIQGHAKRFHLLRLLLKFRKTVFFLDLWECDFCGSVFRDDQLGTPKILFMSVYFYLFIYLLSSDRYLVGMGGETGTSSASDFFVFLSKNNIIK